MACFLHANKKYIYIAANGAANYYEESRSNGTKIAANAHLTLSIDSAQSSSTFNRFQVQGSLRPIGNGKYHQHHSIDH